MSTITAQADATQLLSETTFRDAMGHFVTGVTVVTTLHNSVPLGATVSAFSSLSMEPPMLLVCLNRTSETGTAIAEVGDFTVNFLSDSQSDLAMRFASRSSAKFDGVALDSGPGEHPVLDGALGWVRCKVVDTSYGGTHRILIARAVAACVAGGEPLTYFKGGFGDFTPWGTAVRERASA
ncbi:flavin reductase family protein [Nocardioides carbamazepini]|uniref:flavin reductase family protein n=1 Tax=Nocardioides carbamazepini TaxID=2854259 RepID=UPI00214A1F6C|nr:flavin reductase family protein [Nocardioides carbamazepini]MCR1781304.1 flavin reductase family protein [Nocardioides carbamazepini]